jgi:signal transduction histidine kinase/ligand-binding sensor domain-containing protein/DNA-binding NarL/FixJ family response regulator
LRSSPENAKTLSRMVSRFLKRVFTPSRNVPAGNRSSGGASARATASHTSEVESFGQPAIRTFTDADGLPQNSSIAIAFDALGYLWIGTEDGPARYDGRSWLPVALPQKTRSHDVLDILCTRDGSVWFATRGAGLARRDGDTWRTLDASEGLPHEVAICLAETESTAGERTLWIGTPAGLVRFDGARCRLFTVDDGLPDNVVRCLHATGAGDDTVLWIGTQAGGVASLRQGKIDAAGGLEDQLILQLGAIPESGGGDTILAGMRQGIARYRAGEWTKVETGTPLDDERVQAMTSCVAKDGEPVMWIGTAKGLYLYADGHVHHCDWLGSKASQSVVSLAVPPSRLGSSALWIGTDGGGVARIQLGNWRTLPQAGDLAEAEVMSLAESTSDAGSWAILLSGSRGVSRFVVPPEPARACAEPLLRKSALAVCETRGDGEEDLWIGLTGGGVLRGRPGELTEVPELAKFEAHRIKTGPMDGIWLAGDNGIVHFEGASVERYDDTSGLPSRHVMDLLVTTGPAGGRLVVAGTFGGGVAFLEQGRTRVSDSRDGLPNDLVLCVKETHRKGRRVLWIGTQGGGAAWCELDDPEPSWNMLSDATEPALPNNTVYQIQEDAAGRLYFFTNKGVARLSPDAPAGPTIYTFTKEDGLPSNECNAGASLVDSRGRIWVGTVAGAAFFDPAREVADTVAKPLHVSRVMVNGAPRRLTAETRLPHSANNLTFEFDLLSYFREADTRYRTQLVGFDPEPSHWTAEFKRSYTNLPAGRYEFRVWGRDYAGNVSGPETVAFQIKPAPWRTWWAYTAYGAAASAATAGAVRWRVNTLRRRNEMLEETVRLQTAALAENVEQLKLSESITREKADELAAAVEQLRLLERNAQLAKREALEAKDRAVEASQAKSAFLSSMSHELRTPLNAVLGFTQLMERDVTLSLEQREHLTAIATSGEHLLHLINDVLSLSKIEAGKTTLNLQRFDLHRLVEGVEMMFRGRVRSKGLKLHTRRSSSLPRHVVGDEGKLRQVLINLLGNSVKFTEEGEITLTVRWREGIGEFEVADTGHGIAAAEIDALFEPFAQTESGRQSKEGTGLGLAISRNFVLMMGGDIRVRSEVRAGTAFTFDCELPRAEEVADETGRLIAMELEPNQPEYRILVVDDAEKNRTLLMKLLSAVGFSVLQASDGREAVALWSSWRPHAILMDIRMPVLDGRAAAREIRRLAAESPSGDDPTSKIVALTASVFDHERDEILAAGFDDFLMKPFREEDLFGVLSRQLGARLRYLSADELPSSGSHAPVGADALSSHRFRAISPELLEALGDAVVKGDVEVANALADKVHEADQDLAAGLRALIRTYRFDELQELIDRSRDVAGDRETL